MRTSGSKRTCSRLRHFVAPGGHPPGRTVTLLHILLHIFLYVGQRLIEGDTHASSSASHSPFFFNLRADLGLEAHLFASSALLSPRGSPPGPHGLSLFHNETKLNTLYLVLIPFSSPLSRSRSLPPSLPPPPHPLSLSLFSLSSLSHTPQILCIKRSFS